MMHPTMTEWLEEVTTGPAALAEAKRFLELAAYVPTDARARLDHAAWKAREGFAVVLGAARATVHGTRVSVPSCLSVSACRASLAYRAPMPREYPIAFPTALDRAQRRARIARGRMCATGTAYSYTKPATFCR